MGHWARIDDNNIVQDVVSITEDMLKTENYYGYDKSVWIKTSYNTRGGKHYAPNYDGQTYLVESEDQSKALRWTYAGIGMYYDSVRDIFYLPKPFDRHGNISESWIFDDTVNEFVAPVTEPKPTSAQVNAGWEHKWDEAVHQADNTKGWVLVDLETGNVVVDDNGDGVAD